MAKTKITLEQRKKYYDDLKKRHPDAVLLFRVGDFQQAYGEDAKKIAGILNLPLNDIDFLDKSCAFPHHALDTYLPKLIRANCRVAICDDITDLKQLKEESKEETAEQDIAREEHTEEATEEKKQLTPLDLDDALFDAMGEILYKAQEIEGVAEKFRKLFQAEYSRQVAEIDKARKIDNAISSIRHQCERLSDLTTMWGHIVAVRDMAEDYVWG